MKKSTFRRPQMRPKILFYAHRLKLPIRSGLTVELFPESDQYLIKNYSIIKQQNNGEVEIVIRLKSKT